MRVLLRFTCLLALFTQLAVAAGPAYVSLEKRYSAEQMHATGLDTLSSEQLALLNTLLAEKVTPVAKAEVKQQQAEPVAPEPSENSALPEPSANFIGLNEEPIRSRLRGSISGWEPGTVFELENGQQWKVLKGTVRLREPLQAPSIKVVPGIAGRWFLQVVEDMPKARVYRID